MSTRINTGLIILGLACGAIATACGDDDAASPGASGSGGRTAGRGGATAGSGGATNAAAGGGSGGGGALATSGTNGGAGVGGRTGGAGSAGGAGRAGNAAQVCPSAEPATGEVCVNGRGECTFGTRNCDCNNDSLTWVCWDPTTDCPATKPAEQAACSVVGVDCEFASDTGQGGNDGCECTDTGWDCGGQFCPPAEPAAASACQGGDGVCTYGGRTCDCDSSIWVCWDPTTDCSATPPIDASACTLEGVICEYPTGDCECDTLAWECDIAEDGGV
jgi:hypothetical protein